MSGLVLRNRRLLCVAALLALVLASATVVAAQELPAAVKALMPQAKAEGATAVVYGSDLDPTQAAAMSNAMSEFYGTSFDIKFVSGLHPQKAAEVVQGAKMGVDSGLDIFWTGSAVGVLLSIDDSLRWAPKGLRIHDPMLTGVAYNSDQVPPAEAPRTYQELAKNPKWKGKIAAPRAPNVFVYISYGLGDEATRQLIKDLVETQEMKILPTYPDVTNRVLAGEFSLGIGVTPTLQHRRGAPVDTAPIDPVILTPWAFWLMKDAKHPETAKLLGYWLTSSAGQKMLSDVTALSRASQPSPELARLIEGKKVLTVPHEFNIDALPKLGPVYGRLMGLR